MVSRGSRRVPFAIAAALGLVAGLAGCGSNGSDGSGEPAPEPTSTADTETSPGAPSPDPSDSETPTVEVADGPWLATDYSRVRLPKGSEIEKNFGFDSIKQATLPDQSGIVHMVVHDGAGLTSIDDAARVTKKDHEQRLKVQADLHREDDVALGGDTTGFHLAGVDKIHTVDVYGTLRSGARFTLTFFLNDQLTSEERQGIIDSVLPTWEFLSP